MTIAFKWFVSTRDSTESPPVLLAVGNDITSNLNIFADGTLLYVGIVAHASCLRILLDSGSYTI